MGGQRSGVPSARTLSETQEHVQLRRSRSTADATELVHGGLAAPFAWPNHEIGRKACNAIKDGWLIAYYLLNADAVTERAGCDSEVAGNGDAVAWRMVDRYLLALR
ncbi:hypothetical protein [Burkholderia stagnalis]|uniref:hypothetical protein n=1 Tax=Burkholderia stagnalis TaxID=1503054 RepID=UPI000AF2A905|nr:hypothetical protein [Burkholderia stagnalis]